MKKGVFIALILLLLSSFIVSAANDVQSVANDLTSDLKTASSNLPKDTAPLLSRQINIPEKLQPIARVLFGLGQEDRLDLQMFIIIVALWIMLFLIIHSILELIPFFEEGWKRLIGAIVITLLIAVSRGIYSVALWLFNFFDFFGILARLGFLKVSIAIILVVGFFFISSYLLRLFKESVKIGKAVSEGVKAGAQLAKLKAMADMERGAGI